MDTAYAHSLYAPTPEGFFILKWAWDPALLFFVFLAVFYWRGMRAFKGREPVKLWQKVCFYSGVGVLALALLPPIDPLSDQLFFMHMVQHLLIVQVGVPLVIFGVPFFIALRGLPPVIRKNVYLPMMKNKPLRKALGIIQSPIVALALYEVTFWFWHIPQYYNMALLNDAWHLVEHGTMAFVAMNLWRVVIDPHPMKSPLKMPLRIFFLGFITAFDVALSAALTYSKTIWYAYEGIPTPTWWTWSQVEDQRLGGLIMWIIGGMIWFLAMTATFFVWAHREQAKDRVQAKNPGQTPANAAAALG